jgi:N-carbamoyl-L-amino-acid hydrolase
MTTTFRLPDADKQLAAKLFTEIRTATADGPGVTRQAYAWSETKALIAVAHAAVALGLRPSLDAHGNLSADRRDADHAAVPIGCGSHVDSVPQGGHFDGLAGVIAGLLIAKHAPAHAPVRAYALRGEESAWFGVPHLGAKAMFDELTEYDLARTTTMAGVTETLRDAMAHAVRASRSELVISDNHLPPALRGWIEVHIEQGPVLFENNRPLGVVTGLRGSMRHSKIVCHGQAAHAGTTPFLSRKDPVMAVVSVLSELEELTALYVINHKDLVMTCGKIETDAAAAVSRVAARATFALEWRSVEETVLAKMREHVHAALAGAENDYRVRFEPDREVYTPPVLLDPEMVDRLACGCNARVGAERWYPMSSGAGHDASVFQRHGIPSGMVFIRNDHGSHNPNESMDLEDFYLAVEAVVESLRE